MGRPVRSTCIISGLVKNTKSWCSERQGESFKLRKELHEEMTDNVKHCGTSEKIKQELLGFGIWQSMDDLVRFTSAKEGGQQVWKAWLGEGVGNEAVRNWT